MTTRTYGIETDSLGRVEHSNLAELQGGDSTSNEYYHLTQNIYNIIENGTYLTNYENVIEISDGFEVTGQRYQSVENAQQYLSTVDPAPSASNLWAIKIYGNNSENINVGLIPYVHYVGQTGSTRLTGQITSTGTMTGLVQGDYRITDCIITNLILGTGCYCEFFRCDINGGTLANSSIPIMFDCVVKGGTFSHTYVSGLDFPFFQKCFIYGTSSLIGATFFMSALFGASVTASNNYVFVQSYNNQTLTIPNGVTVDGWNSTFDCAITIQNAGILQTSNCELLYEPTVDSGGTWRVDRVRETNQEIRSLTAKNPITDSDYFVVSDSDTNFSMKKFLVSNLESIIDHNSVTGKQGGTTNEYYHLDAVTYAKTPDINLGRYGFVSRAETTISFDGTDQFTITGTNWSYFRNGTKYTIATSKSVTVATPMVNGTRYYLYLDSTDGTITSATGGWTLNDTKVPVAIIFWNSTLTPKYILVDERHTCYIDRAFHREHHFSDGSEIVSSGIVSGLVADSDLDTNKVFGVTGTTFFDEDLYFSLLTLAKPDGATPTYYNVYRTSTTNWVWAISDMPFKYSGSSPYGYIEYDNGSGVSTQSTGNKFVNTYIFAANVVNNSEPDPEITNAALRYFIIQGRGSYSSASAAYAEAFSSFDLTGFPVAEGVAIYQITWATTNRPDTVKGRCRYYSIQKISANITSTSVLTTVDHNTTTGLQGGTAGQYYHLTELEHDTIASTSYAIAMSIALGSLG